MKTVQVKNNSHKMRPAHGLYIPLLIKYIGNYNGYISSPQLGFLTKNFNEKSLGSQRIGGINRTIFQVQKNNYPSPDLEEFLEF